MKKLKKVWEQNPVMCLVGGLIAIRTATRFVDSLAYYTRRRGVTQIDLATLIELRDEARALLITAKDGGLWISTIDLEHL